jgi:hypothetical protein
MVDVTGLNPNVMYELGHVHAREINPFLIYRRPQAEIDADELPFYLRREKLITEQDNDAGHRRIADAITQYRAALAKNAYERQRRT